MDLDQLEVRNNCTGKSNTPTSYCRLDSTGDERSCNLTARYTSAIAHAVFGFAKIWIDRCGFCQRHHDHLIAMLAAESVVWIDFLHILVMNPLFPLRSWLIRGFGPLFCREFCSGADEVSRMVGIRNQL